MDLGWCTSIQTWDRVPPYQDLGQGTLHPDLGWGTPHSDLGWGTPCLDLEWGTPPDLERVPPPPRKCGQTETITFPHPSDKGGKNRKDSKYLCTKQATDQQIIHWKTEPLHIIFNFNSMWCSFHGSEDRSH